MHKISIINKERQDIIIDKVKFILGNNYENKDLIYRILVNYFNKLNISDYSKDNNIESCIYFDDSPLRIADFDFFWLVTILIWISIPNWGLKAFH